MSFGGKCHHDAPGSGAVDQGQSLPGFYAGAASDLGAYELGADPPYYGPRAMR